MSAETCKTRGSEVYLGCRGQRPLKDRRVVDCAEGDGGRQFCNGEKVLQKRVGQAEEREELERACQILGGSQGEAKLLFMFISFLRRYYRSSLLNENDMCNRTQIKSSIIIRLGFAAGVDLKSTCKFLKLLQAWLCG